MKGLVKPIAFMIIAIAILFPLAYYMAGVNCETAALKAKFTESNYVFPDGCMVKKGDKWVLLSDTD